MTIERIKRRADMIFDVTFLDENSKKPKPEFIHHEIQNLRKYHQDS